MPCKPKKKKKRKKYNKGGNINGPSHEQGGQVIEVEGGEYIINKKAVNPQTEAVLEYINETGRLPYKYGGKIPSIDARKRGKK